MIAQTIAAAVLFILLGQTRRSQGGALGVLCMSMLFWPEYLRVEMGLAEMSVPRLLALALLVKFFVRDGLDRIRPNRIDAFVLAIWLWTVLASVLAGSEMAQTTQMIGRGFDTVLMYFVARFALHSAEDVRAMGWGLVLTALTMCVVGVVEAITYSSPYSSMIGYMTWSFVEKGDEFRLGLMRAQASTATHIYFGMTMMVILGMLWAVRGFMGRSLPFRLSIPAAFLACLSSLSSGPWLGVATLAAMNWFERRTWLIRPAVYGVLFACVAMEAISNRHFYNLIDYLALDPHTAWYRTRLIEVAASQWRDFWIFGVGSDWPHDWAELIDGRDHVDVVNHFLIVALFGGLPAVILYVATHVMAIRRSAQAWRLDADEARRKALFGLSVVLLALDFSSLSVGLFGPVLLMSHVLLGAMVSLAMAWEQVPTEVALDEWGAPASRSTAGGASVQVSGNVYWALATTWRQRIAQASCQWRWRARHHQAPRMGLMCFAKPASFDVPPAYCGRPS